MAGDARTGSIFFRSAALPLFIFAVFRLARRMRAKKAGYREPNPWFSLP
jgi:hypothetical protein